MPDDLYDRDALAWWEHQASLLRRVPPRTWPADCPFTLDQLFGDKRAALEQHLEAVAASSQA